MLSAVEKEKKIVLIATFPVQYISVDKFNFLRSLYVLGEGGREAQSQQRNNNLRTT